MSRMLRGFAFDMDGTLLDSEVLWVRATTAFLRDAGEVISDEASLSLVYGRSWTDIYQAIRERYPSIGANIEMAGEAIRSRMLAMRKSHKMVIEGSVNVLKRLSREYPVCVVSGSPRVDVLEGVSMAGVASDVAFVLGAEDYSPGKPNPACYLMAAERMGVPASQCTAFEDSTAGVEAARAAGMYTVALARSGMPGQDYGLADEVMADLSEFRLMGDDDESG